MRNSKKSEYVILVFIIIFIINYNTSLFLEETLSSIIIAETNNRCLNEKKVSSNAKNDD